VDPTLTRQSGIATNPRDLFPEGANTSAEKWLEDAQQLQSHIGSKRFDESDRWIKGASMKADRLEVHLGPLSLTSKQRTHCEGQMENIKRALNTAKQSLGTPAAPADYAKPMNSPGRSDALKGDQRGPRAAEPASRSTRGNPPSQQPGSVNHQPPSKGEFSKSA
jgi:hypothetical protein